MSTREGGDANNERRKKKRKERELIIILLIINSLHSRHAPIATGELRILVLEVAVQFLLDTVEL